MTSMSSGEMSAEEFDRRIAAGRRVDLDVRLRRPPSTYTLTVTQGPAASLSTGRSAAPHVTTQAEALQNA